jgi:hypothetical protein
MKKNILEQIKKHEIWESRYSLIVLGVSIITNLGIWLLLYFRVEPSEYPIPLHYNIYTGIDAIDYWYKIFIIPGFGLGAIIINLIIGLFFNNKEKFVSYILYTAALIIQVLLLVSSYFLTIGL